MNLPKLVIALLLSSSCQTLAAQNEQTNSTGLERNNLTYAVAWKQTAAEHRALYHQGFNMARLRVELALSNVSGNEKPLAVVSDVDETLLLANEYWGYLLSEGEDFFDDAAWDNWVPENGMIASPGASEFLRFCEANNVEVFYVTNRDQGEQTERLAMQNLASVDFPYVDEEHVFVLQDSSNKEPVQQRIRDEFNVVVYLGDNLNDFARKYYSTDVDERMGLMEEDSDKFGSQFILFPNPTDGHWIRAIFGESEPGASAENRQTFRAAATRSAWDPGN